MKNNYYVLSFSFGKDSVATLLTIINNNLPLNEIIFVEPMFNNVLSGLHPKFLEFISFASNYIKNNFGFDITFLKSNYNFYDCCISKFSRGKKTGQFYGFPYLLAPSWCQSRLKLSPISEHLKTLKKDFVVYQYLGIAYDEQCRVQKSEFLLYPLIDFKLTESDCFQIAFDNNLLAPHYFSNFRDGCWFCPKQSLNSLRDLFFNYNDYWNKLKEIEFITNSKFRHNISLSDLESRFINEQFFQGTLF